MLSIKGVYWNGLRQDCGEQFITGGHNWPAALNLVDSNFKDATAAPVRFKTDNETWDKLDALVRREGRAGRREEIWVTIRGQLRVPEAFIRSDGRPVGGYGHLGVFPAELVVERVLDIEIKAIPTYDYGEILKGPRL